MDPEGGKHLAPRPAHLPAPDLLEAIEAFPVGKVPCQMSRDGRRLVFVWRADSNARDNVWDDHRRPALAQWGVIDGEFAVYALGETGLVNSRFLTFEAHTHMGAPSTADGADPRELLHTNQEPKVFIHGAEPAIQRGLAVMWQRRLESILLDALPTWPGTAARHSGWSKYLSLARPDMIRLGSEFAGFTGVAQRSYWFDPATEAMV